MNNGYKFFRNQECEYYPCHKEIENLNCMFCFCPFYLYNKCPGDPDYLCNKDKKIKDCSNCLFPHKAENYELIVKIITDNIGWK